MKDKIKKKQEIKKVKEIILQLERKIYNNIKELHIIVSIMYN